MNKSLKFSSIWIRTVSGSLATVLVATVVFVSIIGNAYAGRAADKPRYSKASDFSSSKDMNLQGKNLVPFGSQNKLYFPFKPGFKFIMEKPDSPDGYFRKEVKILEKTEPFNIKGIGKFEASIIQEEEYYDGIWTQQALNWFAIDKTNGNVYSFGEVSWEIDDDGNKVFEGTWRAGELDGGGQAEPGLLMPGIFYIGARYIYDGSESESLGGSENMESGLTFKTPMGTFKGCVRVREQSLSDLKDITDKVWCPNVGIVHDTSDGLTIASDAVSGSQKVLASFGQYHRGPKKKFTPPKAKISGEDATKIALKELPGKATSVSIERKRGHNVYVIEIREKKTNIEKDVFVDIETGKIVGMD